jgi:hypothetical protein
LTADSLALLDEVLRNRAPHLAAMIGGQRELDLPLSVLKEVEEAISSEFTSKGLGANGEPNELGLRLESLLDEVLRWVWQKQESSR